MKVSELLGSGGFIQETLIGTEEIDAKGCYIGDLLSWVMGHAKTGDVWVTIMGHPNIVAVAALIGISAIFLSDGAKLEAETAQKAEEEGVIIFTTSLPAFECAKIFSRFGL